MTETTLTVEPNPELDTALADEIRRRSPEVRRRIEQIQELIRSDVAYYAHLGAMLIELKKRHRDAFWEHLRSLDPDVRENHIAIVLRAYHHREKHPELPDVSQLSFVLTSGDNSTGSDTGTGHIRRGTESTRFAEGIKYAGQFSAWLNRELRTPPEKWDPAAKRTLREIIRQWAELLPRLKENP